MSLAIKNVMVLGAGGNLGPAVLQALDGLFTVSILSRTSSSSTFPSKFKIHTIADSYPTEALLNIFKGQDAIVSCMSPWVTELQKRVIAAAVEAGVKHFIPAEFGNDTTNANGAAILPPLQIRADIVSYLKEQEQSGLSWTAIVTGSFFDWGLANGFLGFDVVQRKAMIYDDGNQPFSTSTVKLIGETVAKVLSKPELTRNRYVYVSSFTTTQNKIVAALEKVSGMPWDVTRVSSKDKIQEAREDLSSGKDPVAASRLLILAVQYTPGNGNDFTGKDLNDSLELQKEDMEEVMKRVMQS